MGFILSQRVMQPGGLQYMGQLQENKLVTEFILPCPLECGHSYRKPCRASWGLQYFRASRRLLADSAWGNQGKFQTHSKSQKSGQDGSNSFEIVIKYMNSSDCCVLLMNWPFYTFENSLVKSTLSKININSNFVYFARYVTFYHLLSTYPVFLYI
jgi:hypothetical protein